MKAIRDYLLEHPLVWVIPLVFFVLLLVLLAWRISQSPSSPFIYRI